MSDNTLIEHPCGSATLSPERLNACLEAAYELEALATRLPGLVPNIEEVHGVHYLVRGMAGRIQSLSRVLMAGLSDEIETVAALQSEVFVGGRAAT